MIPPLNSEITLTQTLNYLIHIQKELRKLLRDCAITETVLPRHSLFSSRRIFRTDELQLGLKNFGVTSVFSVN